MSMYDRPANDIGFTDEQNKRHLAALVSVCKYLRKEGYMSCTKDKEFQETKDNPIYTSFKEYTTSTRQDCY